VAEPVISHNCPKEGPMPSMVARLLFAAVTVASILPAAPVAIADEEDPAGWSMSTDPRRRAFLHYAAEAGGPRHFDFGCLRDVDEFFLYAKAVPGTEEGGDVELKLLVADAEWSITGEVVETGDGEMTFRVEKDADARAMKKMGTGLMKVLSAPGPVVLQIGNSETVELTLEPLPPRAGIAPFLGRFEKICFGSK
jgi:hypothetical protein